MVRLYEKYGWVIYLALGLLWLVVGLNQIFTPDELINTDVQHITGMSLSELEASNPLSIELVRFYMAAVGNLKTSWSFFVLAITLTGYRKGEKWAWYAMGIAPAVLVCQAILDATFLGDVNQRLKWIPITSIAMFGLLLPYIKFFPKQT